MRQEAFLTKARLLRSEVAAVVAVTTVTRHNVKRLVHELTR